MASFDTDAKKYINLPDLVEDLEKKGYTIVETFNTSLTVPRDLKPLDEKRAKELAKKARKTVLSSEEVDAALQKLSRRWPQVEKRWADPAIPGQIHCLVSFLPAKGARPDADGLYGYIKCRGTFASESDKDGYAEHLVENVDSYHAINHGMVGQPLPLVDDNDHRYVMEVQQVNLSKKIQHDMNRDMKERRDKESKDVDEARERAKQAREREEEEIKGNVNQEERYTTLRVKRANLIFSIYQMTSSLKRYKDTLRETIRMIDASDKENPEFQNTFLEKYNAACEKTGLPKEKNHIIRYLTGPLPFDLDIIPDVVPVNRVEDPEIYPINLETIEPHKVAQKMTEAAKGVPSGPSPGPSPGALPLPKKSWADQCEEEEKK